VSFEAGEGSGAIAAATAGAGGGSGAGVTIGCAIVGASDRDTSELSTGGEAGGGVVAPALEAGGVDVIHEGVLPYSDHSGGLA
jgi:hypothetical protein